MKDLGRCDFCRYLFVHGALNALSVKIAGFDAMQYQGKMSCDKCLPSLGLYKCGYCDDIFTRRDVHLLRDYSPVCFSCYECYEKPLEIFDPGGWV